MRSRPQTTTAGGGSKTLSWDVLNRIVQVSESAGTEEYDYAPSGQRVRWQRVAGQKTTERYVFYGAGGQRMEEFSASVNGSAVVFVSQGRDVYFAGRLIYQKGEQVFTDRLGSVALRREGTSWVKPKYYPYGELRTGSSDEDQTGFATYERSALTGLDYAQQRYYSNSAGRFLSADPYRASGGAGEPGSWNRYSYVEGDPVNWRDPWGTDPCEAGAPCPAPPVGFGWWGMWVAFQHTTVGQATPTQDQLEMIAHDKAEGLLVPAMARALQALTLNIECLELFGTEETRKNGFDPGAVLTSLVNGGDRGRILFQPRNADFHAKTWPKGGGPLGAMGLPGTASRVDVVINTYTGPEGTYWNHGSLDENARTLLHELGHAFNFIRGAGGFSVGNFAEWRDPYIFDKEIEEHCIPKQQ